LTGPGGGVVEHLVEGHGPAPGEVVGGDGEHVAAEGGAGRLEGPGQLGPLVVAERRPGGAPDRGRARHQPDGPLGLAVLGGQGGQDLEGVGQLGLLRQARSSDSVSDSSA
jgi:hypothetical protein